MLANEEQRLALEQKIAELQLKYEEAEAKTNELFLWLNKLDQAMFI